MAKIFKILVASLTVCLFISAVGISKEDTSRPKMSEWKIDYWGSDNTGLNYEDLQGRCGILLLFGIEEGEEYQRQYGSAATGIIQHSERIQKWAKEKFLDHGLYCQILACGRWYHSPTGRQQLSQLVKQYKIQLPVGAVSRLLWKQLGLHNKDSQACLMGAYILDPYGRIITLVSKSMSMDGMEIPSYEQMEIESAEYWLDTNAKNIQKADKAFTKEKWPEAYKIYWPLADKVKVVEPGKIIAQRVKQIENLVRDDILNHLATLTAQNISKVTSPIRKIQRLYKGTLLSDEVSGRLAVLKRARKDTELLDLIRLYTANILNRSDRKK
ncbi:hypothetical protein ACFL54_05830, partial [Planctomycetota bacterium]